MPGVPMSNSLFCFDEYKFGDSETRTFEWMNGCVTLELFPKAQSKSAKIWQLHNLITLDGVPSKRENQHSECRWRCCRITAHSAFLWMTLNRQYEWKPTRFIKINILYDIHLRHTSLTRCMEKEQNQNKPNPNRNKSWQVCRPLKTLKTKMLEQPNPRCGY